ncbi:MAG: VWA domain-containing protein [Gammaproteobacteria bacterium]
MSRRQRRDLQGLSLSFLDVICCGFGAVILLLVLTKFAEPVILQQSSEDLEALIVALEEELVEIRGETRIVNQELVSRREQTAEIEARVARLQGDLSAIEGRFRATRDRAHVTTAVEGQLAEARQSLSEEMKRLLGDSYRRPVDDTTVGGIPIDSEYIVFIIDTSGSMFGYAWPLLLQKVEEILEAYPGLKGIQVMNDMGQYMFPRYAGRWIPDTPARRRAIIDTLRGWNVFSNSSPVEGVTRAIETFGRSGQRVSLYVMGDEFSGRSIEDVVRTVDRLNAPDRSGQRPVRIHAVGFPVLFTQAPHLQTTGIQFATLMRAVCEQNGGTFVGLTTLRD